MKKDLITLKDLTKQEILELVEKAEAIKKAPEKYSGLLKGKSMLMFFEKPSLRTRVSFEVAMTQLGGHAIYADMKTTPLGEKESISDAAQVASRYCDIIIARLFGHKNIEELGKYSKVPVVNALTDFSHPCQVLSDLLTIKEKKKTLNIKLAYLGDANNNVTHSLLYAAAIVGFDISIGCPKEHSPNPVVIKGAEQLLRKNKNKNKIIITGKAEEAVKDSDVVYTDSWMSYHIPKEQLNKRIRIFRPYQVNSALMKKAKPDAIFMNCLPAMRGYEQTADVIDSKQSVVFDQAENRLHMQKAIILKLLEKR